MVVGDSFQVGKVATWSPTRIRPRGQDDIFAIHPDGKRLAAQAIADDATTVRDKVVFVFNFADYLNTIAPLRK